jgi:hypothetical protein
MSEVKHESAQEGEYLAESSIQIDFRRGQGVLNRFGGIYEALAPRFDARGLFSPRRGVVEVAQKAVVIDACSSKMVLRAFGDARNSQRTPCFFLRNKSGMICYRIVDDWIRD